MVCYHVGREERRAWGREGLVTGTCGGHTRTRAHTHTHTHWYRLHVLCVRVSGDKKAAGRERERKKKKPSRAKMIYRAQRVEENKPELGATFISQKCRGYQRGSFYNKYPLFQKITISCTHFCCAAAVSHLVQLSKKFLIYYPKCDCTFCHQFFPLYFSEWRKLFYILKAK